MKKKLLSALLAMCMAFGSATALPENTFVDDISITSAAAEREDTSWWEDVTLESYDVYNGDENSLINVFFSNDSVRGVYVGIGMVGIVFAFAFAIIYKDLVRTAHIAAIPDFADFAGGIIYFFIRLARGESRNQKSY